ncbi:hypothetical protein [Nocardia sp. NBC_01009]|uniref:hypothetical protein n=1 Tax=Nocardia sp. NBC_01009 TaxID=2975996 RepID=UPI00386F855B|nr:hypothetical protein OHA42_00095 [Nocardia sp. NBC_01009]
MFSPSEVANTASSVQPAACTMTRQLRIRRIGLHHNAFCAQIIVRTKDFEVPIKKHFQGADPARVVERSAVDDPDLLDWYAALR